MKKMMCMLLAFGILLGLCACGQAPAAQKPDEFFRAHADFVIDNSGSPEEADRQIDERLVGFCAAGL